MSAGSKDVGGCPTLYDPIDSSPPGSPPPPCPWDSPVGGTARAPPSSLSHLVWDAQEREGGGKDPAGGQILALPAPGCSPHHPPDLLTQGLQCERVTQAWQPVGTVNKSRVLCRWEQRAHSSHTRILTVPEHSAGCHSFGPLPVLPFQTEMSFDAISLFP